MGGLFSTPKAPANMGPSQSELDAIARREKLAEETRARESREIASRRGARRRRGVLSLMSSFDDRSPEGQGQTTLGPMRNPRG